MAQSLRSGGPGLVLGLQGAVVVGRRPCPALSIVPCSPLSVGAPCTSRVPPPPGLGLIPLGKIICRELQFSKSKGSFISQEDEQRGHFHLQNIPEYRRPAAASEREGLPPTDVGAALGDLSQGSRPLTQLWSSMFASTTQAHLLSGEQKEEPWRNPPRLSAGRRWLQAHDWAARSPVSHSG